MAIDTISEWHRVLDERDLDGLGALIHDDAVFHSPIVHTPQRGKELTLFYLNAAFHVLLDNDFHYVREVVGERDAFLEFQATIDGVVVNGVDMIRFDDDGLIVDFKVMVRPMKAISLMHGQMAKMLESMKG
ncbi:MAG: hypothetical protein ACI8TX_002951 [Hyphomicrobiaceae bacterium]|jgi:hypothetical protein